MKKLHLLPRPRKMEFTGEEVKISALQVLSELNSSVVSESGDEAYRIKISKEGIILSARTQKGLHWGHTTLKQLRLYDIVPSMIINDAPIFAERGVMLDISRDRVPTMQTLFELIDLLASWKINHLQLYVEHTIAYLGHEEIWKNSSPITLEELSAIDSYCKRKGISLNANQNCLGHFERWLKHPKYASMAEVSSPYMIRNEWFVTPNTLCPLDPRVMPFIEDLLSQQLPLCSGKYANIGCDEPWDLGLGRSKDICAREGKGKIFSEHVNKVAEIARKLGKKPQFWCDPHPNEDKGLTHDLIALIWGYNADTNFKDRAEAHLSAGREIWVAPGTNCWNSSTGRTWCRRANLDLAGKLKDASGFLCTAWGDNGHRQVLPLTIFGFADAAMTAWSGPGNYDDEAAGLFAFGSISIGPWLAELGNVDMELSKGERPWWNEKTPGKPTYCNALWQEMNTHLFEMSGPGDIKAWEEIDERLEKLYSKLPEDLDQIVKDECLFALDWSKWIVDRAIMRRKNLNIDDRKKLACRMADLIARHRSLWLKRSRYGGLEDSSARFALHCSKW
ncbi:MAG TPA: family 20 glycosylhydrolase [Victivallales bacterium]|nr:family 20 glycosylhydrolase [Victivallales bacterium]HRU02063.1 family 20 glycosylhydrolase [Victivallales bacterium]